MPPSFGQESTPNFAVNINQILTSVPLKLSDNHWVSDGFRGKRT